MQKLLRKDALTVPPQKHAAPVRDGFALLPFVERHFAYFLITPTLLAIALVNIYPVFDTVRISLTDRLLSRPEDQTHYVGLTNYARVLSEPSVWNAFGVSLIFTTASVGLSFVIGFLLAILLNRKLPGRAIFRTLFIIPWAIPAFVAALTWSWMFNDQFGIIDAILKGWGVSHPPLWLGSDTALLSLTVVMIWKSFPFQILILLAGLQTIPPELYEAAEVDGAVGVQKFWSITLPMIRPVAMIGVLLSIINVFNFFTVPWILTRGGPAEKTNVLPIYSYSVGFLGGDFGFASAMAVLMFLVIMGVGAIYLWQYVRESASDVA